MNTTTLTIESVHGVKQTIVLGPAIRVPTGSQTQQSNSGSGSSQAGVKPTSSAAHR